MRRDEESERPRLPRVAGELRIEMSPRMMASLQLFSSAGEMLCPFVVGICFQLRKYSWFGRICLAEQLFSLAALCLAWALLRRGPVRPTAAFDSA